jgi:preprotein translocase subunit SecY
MSWLIGSYLYHKNLSKQGRRRDILNGLLSLVVISVLLLLAVIIFAIPDMALVPAGTLVLFTVIVYIRTRKQIKEKEKVESHPKNPKTN